MFFFTSWRILRDRSLAGAPEKIHRAVLGRRPILEVEARGAVVVLREEVHRRPALVATRDPVAEIDVGHVALRRRKRLIAAVRRNESWRKENRKAPNRIRRTER